MQFFPTLLCVSGLNHVTLGELHGFGTLSPQLTGDNDLYTLQKVGI